MSEENKLPGFSMLANTTGSRRDLNIQQTISTSTLNDKQHKIQMGARMPTQRCIFDYRWCCLGPNLDL